MKNKEQSELQEIMNKGIFSDSDGIRKSNISPKDLENMTIKTGYDILPEVEFDPEDIKYLAK